MISTILPADNALPTPEPAARDGADGSGVVRRALALVECFGRNERGASAIEYALMAMFFSVTVIGGSSSIRTALLNAFSTVTSAIQGASNG